MTVTTMTAEEAAARVAELHAELMAIRQHGAARRVELTREATAAFATVTPDTVMAALDAERVRDLEANAWHAVDNAAQNAGIGFLERVAG